MELGDRIKKFRDLKGWSQQRLSNETGILRTNLSAYENNKVKPGLATVQKIALALGVNINVLLETPLFESRQVERPQPMPSASQKILDLWNELLPQDQHLLMTMAKEMKKKSNQIGNLAGEKTSQHHTQDKPLSTPYKRHAK